MKKKNRCTAEDAAWLMHEGAITLSQIEANGIRIDLKHVKKARKKAAQGVAECKDTIRNDPSFKLWKKRFGSKTKLTSGKQLAKVLFEDMGVESKKKTKKGKASYDAEALEEIDIPMVKAFSRMMKLEKVNGTFLAGIQRETLDGFLHPFFNLHIAQTFRSQSDTPNFQNFPVRDPMQAEMVRRSFIARKGYQLGEVDYGGVEVCASCFYHEDPALMAYINDPEKDMHRDMAAQCYKVSASQVSKTMRYCAKNQFVFPQFYGDYFINCTKSLWQSITKFKLKTANGKPLLKQLKKKGVTERGLCDPNIPALPGTFEAHIKDVEKDFWNRRFKVYTKWKEAWWQQYQARGYFTTLTGFKISGVLRRNEAINWPVQGVAFQCLLLALILLQRELTKRKMKTLIVGQIHDSIVSDIHSKERDDYFELARDVMVNQVPALWKFINVPLTVDCELSPKGGSWYDKVDYLKGD